MAVERSARASLERPTLPDTALSDSEEYRRLPATTESSSSLSLGVSTSRRARARKSKEGSPLRFVLLRARASPFQSSRGRRGACERRFDAANRRRKKHHRSARRRRKKTKTRKAEAFNDLRACRATKGETIAKKSGRFFYSIHSRRLYRNQLAEARPLGRSLDSFDSLTPLGEPNTSVRGACAFFPRRIATIRGYTPLLFSLDRADWKTGADDTGPSREHRAARALLRRAVRRRDVALPMRRRAADEIVARRARSMRESRARQRFARGDRRHFLDHGFERNAEEKV